MPRSQEKPRLLLAVLTLSMLSVPIGALLSSDGSTADRTASVSEIQSTQTSLSACAPTFVAPEGMSFGKSEAAACDALPATAAFPGLDAKPHRRGWCRCGCGASCETSADCGGSPCDRFITCC
jgi:hypothetical protein